MTVKSTQPKIIRVSDIMSKDPICITGDVPVRELARILDANDISGVPVVDLQEHVIGVVSKTDLLHHCLEGPSGTQSDLFFDCLADGTNIDFKNDELGVVEDFMTSEPVTASPHDPIAEVARLMATEHVHRVIVVDENQHLLGIVTSLDLLGVFPCDNNE